MPNQVSQQRPQTPPNPAAIGIPGAHTIINTHGQQAYSINPAVAQATAVANHHAMQQPPQQAAQLAQAQAQGQAQGPPPHQVQQSQQQAGQPVSQGQTQIPQQHQMSAHAVPYVRRPRSNALKIVNPDTMEEINAATAAAAAVKPSASTATSEGSPAPSEVSLFYKVFKGDKSSKISARSEITPLTIFPLGGSGEWFGTYFGRFEPKLKTDMAPILGDLSQS